MMGETPSPARTGLRTRSFGSGAGSASTHVWPIVGAADDAVEEIEGLGQHVVLRQRFELGHVDPFEQAAQPNRLVASAAPPGARSERRGCRTRPFRRISCRRPAGRGPPAAAAAGRRRSANRSADRRRARRAPDRARPARRGRRTSGRTRRASRRQSLPGRLVHGGVACRDIGEPGDSAESMSRALTPEFPPHGSNSARQAAATSPRRRRATIAPRRRRPRRRRARAK